MSDMKDERWYIFRMEKGDSSNLGVSCIHFFPTLFMGPNTHQERRYKWSEDQGLWSTSLGPLPASCLISLVVWRRKEIGHIFCILLCYHGYHQTTGYLFILSSVTYYMFCLFLSLSAILCPAFLPLQIGSICTFLFQLSNVYLKNSLFPFSFFSHFLIYKADSTQFQVMSLLSKIKE